MPNLRIIDLFSGAGGLTFGFYYKLLNNAFVKRDDVEFVFSNDFAPHAVLAFKKNFGDDIPVISGDICKITNEAIDDYMKGEPVDVIIGGPPCQSFSTLGQRRYDDRAKLSQQYLRILEKVQPKAFVFENVKGILSMREVFYKEDENGNVVYKEKVCGHGDRKYTKQEPVVDHCGELIMDKLKAEFDRLGYTIKYEVLRASDYGVPQDRERVVIVGIRQDLPIEWTFPQKIDGKLTIEDAISDLPAVGEGEEATKYTIAPQNDYQTLMRRNNEVITEHYCGVYGDKIRTVIRNVAEGESKDDFNAKVDKGLIDRKYYLTSGFNNTYGRLERNKPSPTMTNNLSTPSSSRCIHYEQNRALTPREGARIQSFPDWYQFEGSRADVVRQIGNAVPPLMAIHIANAIETALRPGQGQEQN